MVVRRLRRDRPRLEDRSARGRASYKVLPCRQAALIGVAAYCFGRRNCGVEEDRTPDLRIANAALSQLSYHPMEERILALFRSGDNAPVAVDTGAGI